MDDTSPSTAVQAAARAGLADEMDRRGLGFALAHDIGQVRDVVRTSGEAVLPGRLHERIDQAIVAARQVGRPPPG